MSIYLSIYLYDIYVYIYLSIYLSIHPYIYALVLWRKLNETMAAAPVGKHYWEDAPETKDVRFIYVYMPVLS